MVISGYSGPERVLRKEEPIAGKKKVGVAEVVVQSSGLWGLVARLKSWLSLVSCDLGKASVSAPGSSVLRSNVQGLY